eukprot:8876261-Pyramimonas_sp.AAC.1
MLGAGAATVEARTQSLRGGCSSRQSCQASGVNCEGWSHWSAAHRTLSHMQGCPLPLRPQAAGHDSVSSMIVRRSRQ